MVLWRGSCLLRLLRLLLPLRVLLWYRVLRINSFSFFLSFLICLPAFCLMASFKHPLIRRTMSNEQGFRRLSNSLYLMCCRSRKKLPPTFRRQPEKQAAEKNFNNPIDKVGLTDYHMQKFIEERRTGVMYDRKFYFQSLVRSNFRCGRMCCSCSNSRCSDSTTITI